MSRPACGRPSARPWPWAWRASFITCSEGTIWPSAAQPGPQIRRRIQPRHLELAGLRRHPLLLIHVLLCHPLTTQKEKCKQRKAEKWVRVLGRRRVWEQPVCNCLATAGAASVQVQRAAACVPQSSWTHQRCKVKGCLRMHLLTHTNTHMSTHSPPCQLRLATLLTQNKEHHGGF